MKEPLAKGPPECCTLAEHSQEVLNCAETMLNALKPYLELISPLLPTEIREAALLHDIGKAASGMQQALRKGGRWDFRHEVLSTAVLLTMGLNKRSPLAVAAVLTHHKSLDDTKLVNAVGVNADEDEEEDFARIWRSRVLELREHWDWVRHFIESRSVLNVEHEITTLPPSPGDLTDVRQLFLDIENQLRGHTRHGLCPEDIPYIIARGLVMAADHLASSGVKAPLIDLRCPKMQLRPFQERIANHSGSAILEAPTGSGKTMAAIAWALANRQAGERIFYVLPYQASINAMARTLADETGLGFGDEAVGIIHHNALLYEFKRHFDEEIDNYIEADELARKRTDQTRQFYRPIKVVTPFQILKLLFGCKRFEIGLAEMLGGILIFDEIHAYEPHVAALIEIAIKRLHVLGVRYLFMTATFPEFLRNKLTDNIPNLQHFQLEGEDDWEKGILNRARHRLRLHDCYLEDLIPKVIESAKTGSVLVVCNRIEQAKRIYDEIRLHEDETELLHGGFIVRDRHRKETELFRQAGHWQPACKILVATQVVEVSLNISFNTIFTEVAPVDDLLQRFGRINRFYELNKPVDVHVAKQYDAEKVKWIYSPDRLRLTLDSAPDGELLTPKVESDWVQAAYEGGYLEHEVEKYERAKESFQYVVDKLRPLYSGEDEKEFYELFDSIPVVPAELLNEYLGAFSDKRYFSAAELVMSLSSGTFWRLNNEGAIDKIPLPERDKNYVFVVKRHYDPDIGLTDEEAVLPVALFN